MAEAGKKLHVAMFPWLAFGHMIPFLELSKVIALKGHKVSFISTPRNIHRLPTIPPELASNIDFVSLTLPLGHDLPENAEATMDVPRHKVPYLKRAYDDLEPSVTQFLEASTPDWIVQDFASYWLPPIASRLGISRAFFLIFNACSYSLSEPSAPEMKECYKPRTELEQFLVPPEWVPFPCKVFFRRYEVKKLLDLIRGSDSGVSDKHRVMVAFKGCDVIAIRSCVELEAQWIDLLSKMHNNLVIPVGLLPPTLWVGNSGSSTEWLDHKDKGSVVYVALGSEVTPSQDEFTELVLGLELSGLPFFWALRKRNGGDSVELPDGFEERTRERGVVCTSWAPQQEILSHESVGGFLTHCGWSSIIEGICYGQPLVMLPFLGDQWVNSKVFEEKRVGIEIPRNEEDGWFTRDSVAETVKRVMVSEEREVLKEEAMKMSRVVSDKDLQLEYVDKFVDHLCIHRPRTMT